MINVKRAKGALYLAEILKIDKKILNYCKAVMLSKADLIVRWFMVQNWDLWVITTQKLQK